MEELVELKKRLTGERPAEWENLPDIGLYMDQIISYMPRQLISFAESERLTSAMVNNYIKDGLLPRAEGKKYSRVHLAYLTAICAMKQVLSVREIHTLLAAGADSREPEALYGYFLNELDGALTTTADALDEHLSQKDLSRLALIFALRSYADKLACQRILSLLTPGEQKPARKKRG